MSLIEVLVALGLLITVMATTAGFFTTSLKQSNGQTQAQEASVLAEQQLDYTRSVAATSLLAGRTQTAVQAAIATPGIADLSQDVTATGNYDTSVPPANSMAVPISITAAVNGTTYIITTFIDQCYTSVAASQTCTTTDSGNGWVYRITVDVAYKLSGGRACGASSCQFVASTLRDPGTDPCFNINVDYAGCSTSQPTISSFLPNTVTTNTSTTITMTGTNFDPGAKVTIDTGGTISNVNRVSATSVTFTLTTDNTAAAVGTRTIKLANPNGKFAYGTLTITTTAINVASVSPSPIYTGSTNTMTISGSGFQSGSIVTIPVTAGTISGVPTITANTITVTFNAASTGSAPGSWAVTVTNPDGNSDTANFTIQKAPVTLTTINPSSLLWGATRTFTLTGTGFNSGAQVTLDGTNVSETWNSATSMTVILTTDPAVGTRTFAVTNPDGGTASKTFTVTVNP
ncbi:MAG TPA: type II secretion system protein, partial [Frankiaceae bacterium]|nr:type II secretion system protein [Frankiaceae bacterium]